jgi:hypothetical protein
MFKQHSANTPVLGQGNAGGGGGGPTASSTPAAMMSIVGGGGNKQRLPSGCVTPMKVEVRDFFFFFPLFSFKFDVSCIIRHS